MLAVVAVTIFTVSVLNFLASWLFDKRDRANGIKFWGDKET
jgi:hypothetical protein